jgi:hypothetical protein
MTYGQCVQIVKRTCYGTIKCWQLTLTRQKHQNQKTAMDKDFAVIDVETTRIQSGHIPKTKFWGYADSKGYERFETSKKLVKFLVKQSPKFLLHHSNFDVIQLLVDGVYNINILRSHRGKLIRCSLFHHTLQNTYTVFPVSLGLIFESFGYEKTELGRLAKRNYEDCVNGLDCFCKLDSLFCRLVGVSPLECGTVAGTTFKAAQKIAGKLPCDTRYIEAYRGGRVEVFDTNRKQATNYDINSSYPRSFLEVKEKETLLTVKVKTEDWTAPLFDSQTEDMLLFPNGTFVSHVFKSNLERYILPYAEKTKIKVLEREKIDCSWLVKLKELVNKIYDKKQSTGDEGTRLACKFLLNAFYGRIGLKGESERAVISDEPRDGDEVLNYKLGTKKWLSFFTVEHEAKANYPFAAFITDNARGRLYEAFKQNEPLYGDTDSIFSTRNRGQFKGKVGESCGDWSAKRTRLFRARNVKDYEFGREYVLKGGEGHMEWTLKRFAQGKTAQKIERERKAELRKRIVLPNGETIPVTVNK